MNKYPYEAGIYDSWISAKSIKTLLDSKDIDYHLQQALPYDFIWENKKVLRNLVNLNKGFNKLIIPFKIPLIKPSLGFFCSKLSLKSLIVEPLSFDLSSIILSLKKEYL